MPILILSKFFLLIVQQRFFPILSSAAHICTRKIIYGRVEWRYAKHSVSAQKNQPKRNKDIRKTPIFIASIDNMHCYSVCYSNQYNQLKAIFKVT